MTIKTGDRLPQATFMTMTTEGPQPITTDDVFKGAKVAVLALPGAFTPTCSARHLPGYKDHVADFRAKGVAKILCISVNDVFVMGAWTKDQGITDEVTLLADGNADFTRAIGLEFDGAKFGMGVRSQRYSMLVDDGLVTQLNIEEGGAFKVSAADYLLGQL
jgi:peroxiredoxin